MSLQFSLDAHQRMPLSGYRSLRQDYEEPNDQLGQFQEGSQVATNGSLDTPESLSYQDAETMLCPAAGLDMGSDDLVGSNWTDCPEDYMVDPVLRVMPYRSDLLPADLALAVEDIAERLQCPPDFVAASLLVAMSAIVGCRIGIRPRCYDNWTVVPNLWGMVIGRPSQKKSPAIATAENLIRAIESREREGKLSEIESYEAGSLLTKQKKQLLKSAIKKALQAEDDAKANQLADELKQLELKKKPISRRIITTDSTIEELGELLNKYPYGMLLWVDELSGWMQKIDGPNRAGVRHQFMTLWNGTGKLNIDRIARGELVVEHPCLSLFGCATPGSISKYVSRALCGGEGDDGLLQRIQVTVWPDPPTEYQLVDRPPNHKALQRLQNVFESLADLDPDSFARRDRGDLSGIAWLRFEPVAQERFNQWQSTLWNKLNADGMFQSLESHLDKYRSMVPSIALILHLAAGGRGPVSVQATDQAIRWAEYLESHARRLYRYGASPERVTARHLLVKLLKWPKGEPIRARSIAEHGWSGLQTSGSAKKALELLEAAGWLKSVPSRAATGRKTTDYILHPRASELLFGNHKT